MSKSKQYCVTDNIDTRKHRVAEKIFIDWNKLKTSKEMILCRRKNNSSRRVN